MARIGASLSGIELVLLNRLNEASTAATLNSLHLATGKLINYPRDNPTKFMQISAFQSQLSTVAATMDNVTQAASLFSQTQTTMSAMETLLGNVRTELLKDEARTLTPAERAEAQAKIDQYLADFEALVGTSIDGRRPLNGSANFNIQGRNYSQVSNLTVYSTAGDGPVVTAEPARLFYAGTDRYAAANATIRVTGAQGYSGEIIITTDDTLEDVAALINAESDTTGVLASVSDNTLTMQSSTSGSSAEVIVATIAGTFTTTGGVAPGVAYGKSTTYGGTPAISGYVTRAATQAELAYTGSGSNPGANAAITITGNLGSTTIEVLTTETMTQTAEKINNDSHKTGITAAVSTVGANEVITFTTVDYGTNATIDIAVDSGTFAVTGGHGNGSASGDDAAAVINGFTYTGGTSAAPAELRHREKTAEFADPATIQVTGNLGTSGNIVIGATDTFQDVADLINAETGATGVHAYVDENDLVLRSVTTGDDAEVSIAVIVGPFTTVSGTTSDTGEDAVTGNSNVRGNRFAVSNAGFRFDIEFAPDFLYAFDSMTIDGGGLTFALSTSLAHRSTIAIPGLQPELLGGLSGKLSQIATGGAYSGLDGNTSRAIRILDEATAQFTRAQGSVDGFHNAQVTSASNLLSAMQDDIDDAIDQTDGFNEEEELVLLAKNEALVQNAIASLAILGQQRASLVDLLKQIAGLL
ncbi:MAG: hypothetical protein JW809_03430 [Pirellulales bacterium]|nr:hypothetical protein [Pirellulales bacterium]